MVLHNTVITPNTEKDVIKVATRNHQDKLYFKTESINTANLTEGKRRKINETSVDIRFLYLILTHRVNPY